MNKVLDADFEVKCLQHFGFTSEKIKSIVDAWKHKAEYSCNYNKKRYNKRKFNENFVVNEIITEKSDTSDTTDEMNTSQNGQKILFTVN